MAAASVTPSSEIPLAPSLLLGVGLGGFIDSILFHQVLQWHHMPTGDSGGEPMDMVAGLEAGAPSKVVEGVIDHQLLGLHHVRDDLGAPLGWHAWPSARC